MIFQTKVGNCWKHFKMAIIEDTDVALIYFICVKFYYSLF
jgi:hypothetical protein